MPLLRKRAPLSAADNLKFYLAEAQLPSMIPGSTAPPMPPEGHKAHLNYLSVRPEDYRSRFAKIVAPKEEGIFDNAVLDFLELVPRDGLGMPNVDEASGFAFTVPAPGFNIQQIPLPRPTNVQEVSPWVLALPLQTMTRALHVAFPEAREWDLTCVGHDDPDTTLWSTYVWRKTPPPSQLETFWMKPVNPLQKCSVLFAVQPPWIMTPQDMKSFLRCRNLPPFNSWEPELNAPLNSAERVWAKLWDACVRRECHHWVLTTYSGWVFGSFTEGFTAGQILDVKEHNAKEPTILECLVYHVASSIGLVTNFHLPQVLESEDQLEWDMDIPDSFPEGTIDYPDSDSEWDGMDDEPSISAGVSQSGHAVLSAWGSEQEFCPYPISRIPGRHGTRDRRSLLHPSRVQQVLNWQNDVVHEIADPVAPPPPPYVRESSVGSDTLSVAAIYRTASREGSQFPDIKVVAGEGVAGGAVLTTIVEQGPAGKIE
ncbi:hypothetical protein K439DRAFT_1407360 [Ramaria rubella]|nr:hypothetical protein K439DRAFT_1407360 [Ramaria rubella]